MSGTGGEEGMIWSVLVTPLGRHCGGENLYYILKNPHERFRRVSHELVLPPSGPTLHLSTQALHLRATYVERSKDDIQPI